MTATPYRADGGGLGDVYEALEVVASRAQLIAEGFLVAPRVFSAPPESRPDLSDVRVRAGDYNESDLADLNTGKLVGGIVEHWRKQAEGRRTAAFSVNIAHSQAIVAAFVAAGIPAEHLDSATPTKECDAILARLESGETLIRIELRRAVRGLGPAICKVRHSRAPDKEHRAVLAASWQDPSPLEWCRLILDHAGNALEPSSAAIPSCSRL